MLFKQGFQDWTILHMQKIKQLCYFYIVQFNNLRNIYFFKIENQLFALSRSELVLLWFLFLIPNKIVSRETSNENFQLVNVSD